MYSARKPYLKLKNSIVDFFKSPSMFFKQFRSKFSQFEKPYLVDEYKQMHLEWPTWDWGGWEPWDLPPIGPWSPPYFPGIDFPQNSFGVPPDTKDRKCSQGGCIIIDWPPFYVEPGENHKIYISTGAYPVVDIAIIGPITFTSDCIGKMQSPESSLCGVYCGGWMQVEDGAEGGEGISVTFITAEGGSCCYTGEVKAVCDPLAQITYTTLQMVYNEQQSLGTTIGGTTYVWAIASGGGTLVGSPGDTVTYTAVNRNINCLQNPTITLSCDGVQIDSITIAVANPAKKNDGAYWYTLSCYICATQWCVNKYNYSCTDKHIPPYGAWCSKATEAECIIHCNPDYWIDTRTDNQKIEGCCPEGVL